MTRTRTWWLAGLGLVLVAGGLTWYVTSRTQPHSAGGSPPLPVIVGEAITAEPRDLPVTVEAAGTVESAHETVLASKVLARVVEIRAREGTRLPRGGIAIVLDDRDLRADLHRAEAEVQNAEDRLTRYRALSAEGLVAPQTLEDAERTAEVARAARAAAAALMDATVMAAPFDAMVTHRWVEVGEMATPGRPLLRLEDISAYRLRVTMPAAQAGPIRQGQAADVAIDGVPVANLSGTVSLVVPAAETTTHQVTIKIDLPAIEGLRSGLYGRARLVVDQAPGIALPVSTVSSVGALDRVYVVDQDGVVRARLVKLGRRTGDLIEIRSGLHSGERVLRTARDGADGARLAEPSS